jgi:succinoglycan biosynthesis transport protein ExoP
MSEDSLLPDRSKELVPDNKGRGLREYPQSPEVLRAYPVQDEHDDDIRKYIEIIWRHKIVILACLIVVTISTLVGSLLTKPVYKADAKLEISRENPNIIKFEEVLQVENRDDEFYETQFILLKSKSLARHVIEKMNLQQYAEFSQKDTERPSLISGLLATVKGLISKDKVAASNKNLVNGDDEKDDLVNSFIGRIIVSPIRNSHLVDISFLANDPQLAAKAVNSLAHGFIEWNLNRKLMATKEGRNFLKKQLDQAQIKLENSEEEFNSFAKREGIISLDENMNLTSHQFSELIDALAKAENERLSKESVQKQIQNGDTDSIPAVVNDPYLQGLKTDYAKLDAEYSELTATFKSEYPKVKELKAKLDEMRRKMDEATNAIVASIQSDYEVAKKKEDILRKRYEEQRALASQLNEKAIQYNILKREVDTNKSIYETILQRLKETEVSSGITASNVQVVDYASTPLFPYKPKILLNLVYALFVGLFGGVLISFLLEHLNNSVSSLEEIRDRMRFPVLGGIFNVNQKKELNIPLEKAFLLAPRSHFAESFRTIRVSLLLSAPGNPPRTILITSSQPEEGKTTVSINLAVSFAQAGSRVLLMETDFRRPRLSNVFGKNGVGLTSYLTGNATLADIIKEVDIPNLSIIPTGQLPVNPTELLGSGEMKKLLEIVSGEYDQIILDGPPVIGLADSLVISSIVDGTVIVARAGKTPRTALTGVVEKLWSFNARVLGVILNRLDTGRQSYYYKGSYYYGGEGMAGRKTLAPEAKHVET